MTNQQQTTLTRRVLFFTTAGSPAYEIIWTDQFNNIIRREVKYLREIRK
jgi:hypothetical protein